MKCYYLFITTEWQSGTKKSSISFNIVPLCWKQVFYSGVYGVHPWRNNTWRHPGLCLSKTHEKGNGNDHNNYCQITCMHAYNTKCAWGKYWIVL